jgi:hypothetical protein
MRRSRGAGIIGVLLVVLVLVGLAAWAFRGELLRRFGGAPEYTEVSPAAAANAEAKLDRLRTEGDTIRLSDIELASLLRYRLVEQFPGLLQNPTASMSGSTMRIGGGVPTERLPNLQEFERMRPFLPDTTRVDMEGRLQTIGPGRAMLEIEQVSVAGVPVPQRYYARVLSSIGRRDEPGLPANAVSLPLPEGIGSASVQNGYLVLTP